MQPIKLVVQCQVPSLNQLFKAGWRGRHRIANETQLALLSSLQASESDLLTKMRLSGNTLWMLSATADCSPATRLAAWITRSDKIKSHRNPMNEPK